MKIDGKLEGVVVVGIWSESVGVVIEAEKVALIWLIMSEVTNCCHVVEDNRPILRVSRACFSGLLIFALS